MAPAEKLSRDDPDYYHKLGTLGGKQRTRGYFGYLKDQGDSKKLAEIAATGGKKAAKARKPEQHKGLLRRLTQGNKENNED